MARMPPKTSFFYHRFLELANPEDPFHEFDLERFRHFIWVSQMGRTTLTGDQLRHQMEDDGLEPEDAATLSQMYEDGRSLLEARRSMPYLSREDWANPQPD